MSTNGWSLVYVKWRDAHGSGGSWEPMENAVASSVIAQTVGWLTDQNETDINLVQTVAINKDDEDAYYNRLDIPKGMIVEMKEIPGFKL